MTKYVMFFLSLSLIACKDNTVSMQNEALQESKKINFMIMQISDQAKQHKKETGFWPELSFKFNKKSYPISIKGSLKDIEVAEAFHVPLIKVTFQLPPITSKASILYENKRLYSFDLSLNKDVVSITLPATNIKKPKACMYYYTDHSDQLMGCDIVLYDRLPLFD